MMIYYCLAQLNTIDNEVEANKATEPCYISVLLLVFRLLVYSTKADLLQHCKLNIRVPAHTKHGAIHLQITVNFLIDLLSEREIYIYYFLIALYILQLYIFYKYFAK